MGHCRGALGWRAVFAALAALALSACASTPYSKAEYESARLALDNHIRVLASEEYGGREPGTQGGRLTQQYIVNALESYGYEPGGVGGTWRQNVGLVRYSPGETTLTLAGGKKTFELSGEGVVLQFFAPRVRIEERDAVFVGSAEGLEEGSLTGQIAFVRYSDYVEMRSTVRAAEPAVIVSLLEDEELFGQLSDALNRGQFGLVGDEPGKTGIAALSPEKTKEFETALGKNLEQLVIEAKANGAPILIDSKASLTSNQKSENRESANVIGVLPGKVRGSGVVLLLAHWDHLGICRESDPDDRLCNGAIDNASGVGMMLETARIIAATEPLDRDVFVVGLTAEELGLLGAKVFVDDPPAPLPTIVGAFNMDAMAVAPRGSPITVVGAGLTPLDPGIYDVATALGRSIDIRDEHQQFTQRQDGWVLLSRDVPTVVVTSSFADQRNFDEFISRHYHKPSDEWRPDLELGGATEDILLHVELLKYFGNVANYRIGE